MLSDNATLCNGSDTTLSNPSPIALFYLLLLGHLIHLSISSPLAPWAITVTRSLCEISPFRDLPKSPTTSVLIAQKKLELVDKIELGDSGLNTLIILVGVRVIWHGDDTTNGNDLVFLLILMQFSMRVCVFLPSQEMILKRDSSFPSQQ
jgi:hypothetical protein